MERNLAEMHPSYLGLVMATGIVAIASHLLGLTWIGQILFWLSVVCYATLWLLILARLAFFPRAMATFVGLSKSLIRQLWLPPAAASGESK